MRVGLQQLSGQKLEGCKINFHYLTQNKKDRTNRKKRKRTGQKSSVSIVTRLGNEWLRKWRLPNMAQTGPLPWTMQDTNTSAPILQCLDTLVSAIFCCWSHAISARAHARVCVCVCACMRMCVCVCARICCVVCLYIYIYMCVCLSYNAFDKWPQSSLLSCTGRLKFKICELRITRYPNLEFFKLSTIIMQSTWAFRLPSLLNMGKQAYSERFKCVVCVCVPLDDFWTNQQL